MIRTVSILCLAAMSAVAAPTINIAVRAEDGTPLSGIPVILVELERPFIAILPVGETDSQGRLGFTFEDRKSTEDGDRGYGAYRFVLTPKDRPWALSDLYIWYPDPADCARYLDPAFMQDGIFGTSNWQYGQRRALARGDAVEWAVTLPKKRPVEILVCDDRGFPIPNAKILVEVDLEALSHTGYGASMPFGEFTTDLKGRFIIPNAGDFCYSFGIQSGGYIAPNVSFYTEVLQKRLSGDSASIHYHRVLNAPLTVIVTDASTGRPIPNATIWQGISYQGNYDAGPIGRTGQNGRFHTDTFQPEHTSWLGAKAEGYAQAAVEQDVICDSNLHEYAISLPSKPPAKGSK